MRLRSVAWTMLLLASGTLPARAQEGGGVEARARVDSSNFQVGDPITLHIDLRHPRGASIQPPAGDSLGAFIVLERMPVTPAGDTAASTGLVLAYYDSGTVTIPPALVPYAFPGDTAGRIAGTNPVTVTVHTVAVDTGRAYRDLKPPLSVPMTLAELALYAAVLLAVAGLAYAAYRFWKKRKARPAPGLPPAPARPAHLMALEELAALLDQKLWQRGLVKEYYSGITEVVRRYFERRFSLPALEETTDEILRGLRTTDMPPAALEYTARMLRLADLVKFARYVPGVAEHEEAAALARATIEETRPAAAPPPPAPSPAPAPAVPVESHVGS